MPRWRSTLWRWTALATLGTLTAVGGCLPPNYFADLAGSSISAVVGVLLSDALNVLLPPI